MALPFLSSWSSYNESKWILNPIGLWPQFRFVEALLHFSWVPESRHFEDSGSAESPPETTGGCWTGRQSMGSGPPGLPQLPNPSSSTTTWLHGLWRPAPDTFPTQALLATLPFVQQMGSRQLRWISRCWVTLLSFSSPAGSYSFSHSFSGLWIPWDDVRLFTPAHATL